VVFGFASVGGVSVDLGRLRRQFVIARAGRDNGLLLGCGPAVRNFWRFVRAGLRLKSGELVTPVGHAEWASRLYSCFPERTAICWPPPSVG